jgi:ligand-binding SRPBCC domain-containing protein
MPTPISLRFESKLQAPKASVWEWITSIEGISAEMWPYFRMTTPKGIRSLTDLKVNLGDRLFRSYVFLFGVLPIDYSDMTLIELDPGQGFVEQSPMGSMTLWRHERRLIPFPSEKGTVQLVDQLTFQPRFVSRFVGWFIKQVFVNRHKVLRAHFSAG